MNNLDFLNLNTLRNYPIKDDLSRVSLDGVFTIPNDLIADLSVSSPGNSTLRLYISKLINASTHVYIEVSIYNADVIGSFNIPAGTASETDIYLVASATRPGSQGILTVGSMDTISLLPSGEYAFDITATELLMRVYTPSTTGVNFVSFQDSNSNTTTLTGDVVIQGESNLQFRIPTGSQTVFIDAGENLGLNKSCDAPGVPIKSINGVPPDSVGNFNLIPSDCISIDTAEYGLVLSNTCGKPCLGCNDISTLTTRLIALESDLLTIRDYVNNLQGLITQLTTLVNYQCQC